MGLNTLLYIIKLRIKILQIILNYFKLQNITNHSIMLYI